jgi:hypothetical protein
MCQAEHVAAMPCHLGGARRAFLCSTGRCGRRVGILYGGKVVACRHCRGTAYLSQAEPKPTGQPAAPIAFATGSDGNGAF